MLAVELSSYQLHWAPSVRAHSARRTEPRPRPPRLARLDGGVRRRQGPCLRGQQRRLRLQRRRPGHRGPGARGRRRGGLPRRRLHPRRRPDPPNSASWTASWSTAPSSRTGRSRPRNSPRSPTSTRRGPAQHRQRPRRRRPGPRLRRRARRRTRRPAGLPPRRPPHRARRRRRRRRYIDDSKATNTHAAEASLAAYDPIVWIAGGLAKGATFDELVARVREAAARCRPDRRGPRAHPRSPRATRAGSPCRRPRPDRHWGDVRGGPGSGAARASPETRSCWPRPAPPWTCSPTTTSAATRSRTRFAHSPPITPDTSGPPRRPATGTRARVPGSRARHDWRGQRRCRPTTPRDTSHIPPYVTATCGPGTSPACPPSPGCRAATPGQRDRASGQHCAAAPRAPRYAVLPRPAAAVAGRVAAPRARRAAPGSDGSSSRPAAPGTGR